MFMVFSHVALFVAAILMYLIIFVVVVDSLIFNIIFILYPNEALNGSNNSVVFIH